MMDDLLLGIGNAAALLGGLCAADVIVRDRMLARHYEATTAACARLYHSQIRNSSSSNKNKGNAAATPVTIAVVGYPNHGRSSFVNTLFRVLYREDGAPLLRAVASPSRNTTKSTTIFSLANTLYPFPQTLLHVLDTPPVSANENALKNILKGRDPCNSGSNKVYKVPEAVILVANASECSTGAPAWKSMPLLANLIRREGLEFVVVLTHKKQLEKESMMDAKQVCRQLADRIENEKVYCLENFTIDGRAFDYGLVLKKSNRIAALAEDYNTRCQTLQVVTECLHMARRRRKRLLPKPNAVSPSFNADDDSDDDEES